MRILTILLLSYSVTINSSFTTNLFDDLEQANTYFNAIHNPQHEVGRQIIKRIAQNLNHHRKFEAIRILFESNLEEDKVFARDIILKILLTDKTLKIRESAANILITSLQASLEDKLTGARAFFWFNPQNQLQNYLPRTVYDAGKVLDLNNDPDDQIHYFPIYNHYISHTNNCDRELAEIADKLFASNNLNYQTTAFHFYKKFIYEHEHNNGYVKDDLGRLPRRELFKNLLKNGQEEHKDFGRTCIKMGELMVKKKSTIPFPDTKNYDLLFSFGNENDKNHCRAQLMQYVEDTKATNLGPAAALALYCYGNETDRNYIRGSQSRYAQEIIVTRAANQ